MYPNFTRETFIVGLEEMQLPQNAENCKLADETIINKLEMINLRFLLQLLIKGKIY